MEVERAGRKCSKVADGDMTLLKWPNEIIFPDMTCGWWTLLVINLLFDEKAYGGTKVSVEETLSLDWFVTNYCGRTKVNQY